jgi:hypothetical protein
MAMPKNFKPHITHASLVERREESVVNFKGSIAPRQHRQVPPVAALVAALASTIIMISDRHYQKIYLTSDNPLRVWQAGPGLDLNYLEFRSNDKLGSDSFKGNSGSCGPDFSRACHRPAGRLASPGAGGPAAVAGPAP